MFKQKVKAYFVVFENESEGVRHLCDLHYETAQVRHISLIHSDVYNKK